MQEALAMKLLLIVGLVFWFVCGFAGAWMLDDMHWKTIARGGLTLVDAFNEDSPTLPTGR
jgi:hypothetical protein